MKTSIKALSLIIALLMALAVSPASLAGGMEPNYTVPSGYNAHDYGKCVDFLEQVVDGQKNGLLMDENYDPNDPETWGHYWHTMDDGFTYYLPCFAWVTVGGEKRLDNVYINARHLRGLLDLSGCTALKEVSCMDGNYGVDELDFTGCVALREIWSGSGKSIDVHLSGCASLVVLQGMFTSLELGGCPALTHMDIQGSSLSSLDISANTELTVLNCENTMITSLDVSHNTKLEELWFRNSKCKSFDFSNNPKLGMCYIDSEGDGTIGYTWINNYQSGCLFAFPTPGESFLGWFDTAGSLVSGQSVFETDLSTPQDLTARFTGDSAVYIGDVDGNGVVNANDALIVLRSALGLIPALGAEADVNGDGAVNANDALLVLRCALGLIEL